MGLGRKKEMCVFSFGCFSTSLKLFLTGYENPALSPLATHSGAKPHVTLTCVHQREPLQQRRHPWGDGGHCTEPVLLLVSPCLGPSSPPCQPWPLPACPLFLWDLPGLDISRPRPLITSLIHHNHLWQQQLPHVLPGLLRASKPRPSGLLAPPAADDIRALDAAPPCPRRGAWGRGLHMNGRGAVSCFPSALSSSVLLDWTWTSGSEGTVQQVVLQAVEVSGSSPCLHLKPACVTQMHLEGHGQLAGGRGG